MPTRTCWLVCHRRFCGRPGILANTIAFPQESPTSNAFARAEETQADLAAMKRFEHATFTKELETVATEAAEPILLPDAGPEERWVAPPAHWKRPPHT